MPDITSYRKDSERNILASPPTADGELAFAVDTYKFFISAGDHWSVYYNSKNFGNYVLEEGSSLNYKPIYHLDAADNTFLRSAAGTVPNHLDSVTKIICKSTGIEITGATSTSPKYISEEGVPTIGEQINPDIDTDTSSSINTDTFWTHYRFRTDFYYVIDTLDSNVSFEKIGASRNEVGAKFWPSYPGGSNLYLRNDLTFGDVNINKMFKDSRYTILDNSFDFTNFGAEVNSIGTEFVYNGNELAPRHQLQNLVEGQTYEILERQTEFDYTIIGSENSNHGTQFVYNGAEISSEYLEILVSDPIPEVLVKEKDWAGDGTLKAFFQETYVMPEFVLGLKQVDDQTDARIGGLPTLQFNMGESLTYDKYAHIQKYSGFGFTTFFVGRVNYAMLRKYVQLHGNTHLYHQYSYSWRGLFSGGLLGTTGHGVTLYPDQRWYIDWMGTQTDYGASGPAYGIPFIICARSENSESGQAAYGIDFQTVRGNGTNGLHKDVAVGYHSRSATTGLFYESFYGGLYLNASERNSSPAGMEFAELMVFDNYLNDSECDIVGKYLSNKWKCPWQVISPLGEDYRQVLNPLPKITQPSIGSLKNLYFNT